jgi:hypothetical protein
MRWQNFSRDFLNEKKVTRRSQNGRRTIEKMWNRVSGLWILWNYLPTTIQTIPETLWVLQSF